MKKIADLAIFSQEPLFTKPLYVGTPTPVNKATFLDKISDILDRNWLTNNGIYVKQFEKKICQILHVKHCIALCNGTIALEILIHALGLKGEVIIPSFTFIATAHALQWQGIKPIFCEVDPITHNIDPTHIEKLITPETSAILAVHLWGRPCAIEKLTDIANKYQLKLIFDAAHAFGCSYHQTMIGNFGEAEVFSFHATKVINTLEGGAIVTNNDDLAEKLQLIRNFGFVGYDNVQYLGTNGKMNEISAAMGISLLEDYAAIIAKNLKNYQCYENALACIKGVNLLKAPKQDKFNYQYIVLELDPEYVTISQEDILSIMHAENIIARRYFYPGCHKMQPYLNLDLCLPITEKLSQHIVVLPTGNTMDCNKIEKICGLLQLILENQGEILSKIKART